MSFTAAILFIAQSASPAVAEAPTVPVAERVTASVRVIRPTRISFGDQLGEDQEDDRQNVGVQRSRDEAGTPWVEFS